MTKLRERMLQDMQLRGFSERTQECYLRSVRLLAQHFNKPPDQITEEELRKYFLYVKNVKKWKRATVTISLCGIKFFYTQTCKKRWTTFDLVRPLRERRLPVILTREEIQRILKCVRFPIYRVCLLTIYSCGLRLTEGATLKVSDIDGQRMVIHVEQGKGGKDILPSHKRAIDDIILCRTRPLGGTTYYCEPCDQFRYSYHSCKNRACTKCGNDDSTQWLAAQTALLLPVQYFLVTSTLPAGLRPLARSNQRLIYGLLLRCTAEAVQKLARDPEWVGGEIGLLGNLQTLRLRSGQALET